MPSDYCASFRVGRMFSFSLQWKWFFLWILPFSINIWIISVSQFSWEFIVTFVYVGFDSLDLQSDCGPDLNFSVSLTHLYTLALILWFFLCATFHALLAQFYHYPSWIIKFISFSLVFFNSVGFSRKVFGSSALPCCFAAKYKYVIGVCCCYNFKPTAELVTEPNWHLCERESWHTAQGALDTDIAVLHVILGIAGILRENTLWVSTKLSPPKPD